MTDSMGFAPLAIFAFTRTETLRKVLTSLASCENLTGDGQRPGYAFVDGPRSDADRADIECTREQLERFRRDHFPHLQIIVRETNLGNTVNMPRGIEAVLEKHGRIIVVEDDVLVSRHFLTYMDAALERYRNDRKIWCVNAWRNRFVKVPRSYPHDVYLTPRNMCWGWGTWRDRWQQVDFTMADWPMFKKDPDLLAKVDQVGIELKWMLDRQYAGELHAWDVQCSFHMIQHGLYAVEPRLAMTKNIGFGTECDHCSHPDVDISSAKFYHFNPRLPTDELRPDPAIYGGYRYGRVCPLLGTRIKRKLLRVLWGLGPKHDEAIEA